MGSELVVGLRLGVIGLSLTFLALGLLILVMILLVRFFPERSSRQQPDQHTESTVAEADDDQRLEEMAVALAVGICLLEHNDALEFHDPTLGKLLE